MWNMRLVPGQRWSSEIIEFGWFTDSNTTECVRTKYLTIQSSPLALLLGCDREKLYSPSSQRHSLYTSVLPFLYWQLMCIHTIWRMHLLTPSPCSLMKTHSAFPNGLVLARDREWCLLCTEHCVYRCHYCRALLVTCGQRSITVFTHLATSSLRCRRLSSGHGDNRQIITTTLRPSHDSFCVDREEFYCYLCFILLADAG